METDQEKPDGYCRDCGEGLFRGANQADAICPECGVEFNWLDELTWADSFWYTKAAARRAGMAACTLAVVFAASAIREASPAWLLAFAASAFGCFWFALRCLR